MVTEGHVDYVTVRDNGLRSFVPPCFCFDVVAESGDVVAVVSDIDLTSCGLSVADVIERRLRVNGRLTTYTPEGPPDLDEGLRLVVEHVENLAFPCPTEND